LQEDLNDSDDEADEAWAAEMERKAAEKGNGGESKSGIFQEISEENQGAILGMSKSEIEEAQASLLHTLPPALRDRWKKGGANWGKHGGGGGMGGVKPVPMGSPVERKPTEEEKEAAGGLSGSGAQSAASPAHLLEA